MTAATALAEARPLFGQDLLGPEELRRVLGADPHALVGGDARLLSEVPYDAATLRAAHGRGELLVLRVPTDGHAPLTTLRLRARFPNAIQEKLMRGVGYQLKDEWTLERERFAASATCSLGWRLAFKAPIPATCNLSYGLQDEALGDYAASAGLGGVLRRRSAIEILYDTILYERATGVRLLEREWDWSDTPTADGGFITAGAFAPDGLSVLGYSRAVRFGTLGICGQH